MPPGREWLDPVRFPPAPAHPDRVTPAHPDRVDPARVLEQDGCRSSSVPAVPAVARAGLVAVPEVPLVLVEAVLARQDVPVGVVVEAPVAARPEPLVAEDKRASPGSQSARSAKNLR